MISFKKIFGFVSIFPFIITNFLIAPCLANETPIEEQKLLLWRVDPKPGSLYSTYILGTYHIGKNCQLQSPAFEHAFSDAETVVFELDSIQDPDLQPKIQETLKKLIYDRGIPNDTSESLKEILDPKTYELLKQKTEAFELPIEKISYLKPWVFMWMYWSTQMSQTTQTQTGYSSECGLDPMIAKKSQSTNKTITGLETINYQIEKIIDLFISMDLETTLAAVNSIIQSKPAYEGLLDTSELDLLISNIDAGNTEHIEASINDWCKKDANTCESLLFARNRNWIPKIEQFLK